jgi:hypothetical protein
MSWCLGLRQKGTAAYFSPPPCLLCPTTLPGLKKSESQQMHEEKAGVSASFFLQFISQITQPQVASAHWFRRENVLMSSILTFPVLICSCQRNQG